MPKVSVILTSFNHAAYIKAAIESVLAQTFSDFELIIGDDHSSDDSWEIINAIQDPRIRSFRCEHNTGNVINVALRDGWISGEYVAVHHSDDLWEPEKLTLQVAFLDQHPDMAAVFTRVRLIDEHNKISDEIASEEGSTLRAYQGIFDQENRTRTAWLKRFFYQGNCLCHPSVMLRRSVYEHLGHYNTYYRQLPDFDYWVRLCMTYKIHVLQERLVRYRVLSNNKNTSAQTLENGRRVNCEMTRVLLHYCKIKDLHEIFPESQIYTEQSDVVPSYVLARIALSTKNRILQHYGLQLLNSVLIDSVLIEKTRLLHPSSLADIGSIMGSISLFDDNEELLLQQGRLLNELRSSVILRDALITELRSSVTSNDALITELRSSVTSNDALITELRTRINSNQDMLFSFQKEITIKAALILELNDEINNYKETVLDYKKQLAESNSRCFELEKQNDIYCDKISRIQKSMSWKVTAPLRAVRRFFE
ncbi:MAG: glycosyltransferase [Verrucomicrobia bacterium]|nr:glycosyltransferase [Verrucomicrobiota bacterium]